MARDYEGYYGQVDVEFDGPVMDKLSGDEDESLLAGFVFVAALGISIAGLIAIGIGIGLLF